MAASVRAAAAALREALAGFEPAEWPGAECAGLAEELARTEKACAAARLLAAARAVEAGAHRDHGAPDGAAWLARQGGSTPAQARQALETARRLAQCAETRAAAVAGTISLAQAGEITAAEAATPGAEAELVAVARGADLAALRDHARDHYAAHTDPAEAHRRQVAARGLRHWRDREGMVRLTAALPPEAGLPLVRRVEVAALRRRRAARAAGGPLEGFDAYAADALAELVAGGPGESRPGVATELVVVCDLFAWRRGHAHPGEVCRLIGGGPIPPGVARELAQDAFVKAVLHDGVEIHTVAHFGRHLPAALRTALDLGPVPDFSGRQCADCGARWGLQYDHVEPLAHAGPTSYANFESRCWWCHQAKTERDRQAGLLGPRPRPPPETS